MNTVENMNYTENATIVGVKGGKNLFLATVLARSCSMPPGQVEVENFFSLPEFLFSACLFVTFANAGPTLIGLLVQLNRFLQFVLSLCRRKLCRKPKIKPTTGKNKQGEVLPKHVAKKSKTNSEKIETDRKAVETSEAEPCPIVVDTEEARDVLVPILEEQAKKATRCWSCLLVGEENSDDDGEGDGDEAEEEEEDDEEKDEEDSERTKVVEMWTNVIHAALTLYTIWSYLVVHVPVGASGMCRAAHTIVVPLFKPATASMWLPSCLWYNMHNGKWNDSVNIQRLYEKAVLPGVQPFGFHWLSFLCVAFVGIAFHSTWWQRSQCGRCFLCFFTLFLEACLGLCSCLCTFHWRSCGDGHSFAAVAAFGATIRMISFTWTITTWSMNTEIRRKTSATTS